MLVPQRPVPTTKNGVRDVCCSDTVISSSSACLVSLVEWMGCSITQVCRQHSQELVLLQELGQLVS